MKLICADSKHVGAVTLTEHPDSSRNEISLRINGIEVASLWGYTMGAVLRVWPLPEDDKESLRGIAQLEESANCPNIATIKVDIVDYED